MRSGGSARRGFRAAVSVAVAATLVGVALAAGCGSGGGSTNDGGMDGTVASCGTNSTLCGGSCVTTATDNANCGACGTVCSTGTVCSQGKCGTSCGGGTTLCGSSCADTKVDPSNCGACNAKCATNEVCTNGACGLTCGSGQTLCGGDSSAPFCANEKTDNANCGGCGIVCGAGQVCQNGACSDSCAAADGGVETLCTPDAGAPYCANTSSDNMNCGTCGVACPGGTLCADGSCTNSCPSEDGGVLTLCTPDGGAPYCTDTTSDPNNCGSCGFTCGASVACVSGVCASCAWNVTAYTWPITIHPSNYFGGIAFDRNCNILACGGFSTNLYSISKATGTVTVAATGFTGSTAINGVVYRSSDDTVYVVTDGSAQLFKIVSGTPQLIMSLPATINDIAVVPAGFGTYGGELIGVSTNADVYILDTTAKTATSIGTTSGILSDIVMAPDGSLAYIANNSNGKVQTMTSAGVFTDLVTGITSVDGLAIDAVGANLYATMSYDSVQKIDIATKSATSYVASVSVDPGYYVTGMKYDAAGHLFVVTTASSNAVLNHY